VNKPINHIYEFGDFRLDGSKRVLLRRSGEPVQLTPKAFDTLVHLLDHSGSVVDKNDLMTAVWPDTAVEENNLSQNVYTLRRVLGQGRGEHNYIVTVPGRGYKFVADVRNITSYLPGSELKSQEAIQAEEETEAVATVTVSAQTKQRTASWKTVALVAGGITVALAVGGMWRAGTRPTSGQPVRTIAVLPFKPVILESRDEALELGIADTLISRLSTIEQLTVRPLSMVRRYGGLEQDPLTAGRELVVEAVLDGHIQRLGDRVRVTARLLDVRDEKQLWDGQFDGKFTDIFEMQDSISQRVVGELAVRLTGAERQHVAKRYTTDAEAYALYLKGRFFISLAQPKNAIDLFEQAVRRDPEFALAHAGLADIYSRLPIATDAPSHDSMPKARKAAVKALEIDDRLAEAYSALGWIDFYYEWDWKRSESNHRRAIEINPNDFSAHLGYAHLLSNTGRHEEALREVGQALRLDPLSPLAQALKGQFLLDAGRDAEATEQLHKMLAINPTFWVALVNLGRSCERAGEYEGALAAFRKATESGGSRTLLLSLIGYTYAVSGHAEEAERMLAELRALSENSYVPPYYMATIHKGLGHTAEALTWLETAYNEKDVRMVFLGLDSHWDSLRSNPRFVRLMDRMNLNR
jgi:DNA-binding winged helix-turn-helix (wHTH) protein/TolB-like protein/cytochrome c-type biogenesis protein CcmH/NrfG